MPIITPPRGPAGATFNGGTIANPLTVNVTGPPLTAPLVVEVDAPSATGIMLTAKATSTPNALAELTMASNGTVEWQLASDGTAIASVQVADGGTADGVASLLSNGQIFSQPRSTSAAGDVIVELLDNLGNDVLVTHANGAVFLHGLPGADPGVSGQLYTVAGVLHVSP